MLFRTSTAITLLGLLAATATAAPVERSYPADSIYARQVAPLSYESAGRYNRACGYRSRAGTMNLIIDNFASCPAAVLCEGRRAGGDLACRAPAAYTPAKLGKARNPR